MRYTLFFVLLFLISFAFAQGACDIATKFMPNEPGNWIFWAVIGISISTAIISIIYMFGRMVGKVEFVTKAKADLTQVLVTLIIVVIFESFILATCAIDLGNFGFTKTSGNLFDGARAYFETTLSIAKTNYAQTSNAIMLVSAFSSTYGGFEIVKDVWGLSFSPFAGLGSLIAALQYMMGLVMLNIAVASAQLFVLDTIIIIMTFLLPIGVVCRCFMPTREFGGVLIAIGIGLYVFYPLMFSFSHLLMGEKQPVKYDGGKWYVSLFGISTVGATIFFYNIYGLGALGSMTYLIAEAVIKSMNLTIPALFSLGTALMFIYVLPAINWIIIAALVRDLSRALGSEVDISSLGRML